MPLATIPIALSSGLVLAQQDDLCFMQRDSGKRVPLSEFCGKSVQADTNKRKIVRYEKGKRLVLPNGDVFEADGTITKKNGVRIKPVLKNGRVVGAKFYNADGTELHKGRGQLSSGENYRLR
jgi:hypothetical protein